MDCRLPGIIVLCGTLVGCGTTKWTDTQRSATEQLLISDAMDRAVSQIDFRSLAGKTVYLDADPLRGVTDSDYLISSLRQHMLASGCVLKDDQSQADYIVEARCGAVGTDQHELIYGIPGVDIPATIPVSGVGLPTQIPEIPFVTKKEKRAVTKIAVFAYNRQTGRPVWQSGVVPTESTAKAIWVFGAGPFQRGSIYEGTEFAGDKLRIPLINLDEGENGVDPVSVADEAYFVEPKEGLAKKGEESKGAAAPSNVVQTGHSPPPADGAPAGTAPAKSPPANDPPAGPPPANDPPASPPPANKPATDNTPSPAIVPAAPPATAQEPATEPPPPDPSGIGPAAPLPPSIDAPGEPRGLASP